VAARRPRVKVSYGEQREVVGRFVAALTTGDVQELMNVLAPDVVMVADGGGLVPSIRKPIEGRQRVLALLSRFAEIAPGVAITRPLVNGAPAARIDAAGEQDTVITFVIENDRITHLYAIRNPRKLSRMETEAELRRR
jgi:RNA polymerase sigma-70 factor (ECF subfamily)